MALSTILRHAAAFFAGMWFLTFTVTRMYALHEAYTQESVKRSDEKWLLEKCREPEFHSNLRQHSTLCTEVYNNAQSNLFLRAFSNVLDEGMHLCGKKVPCTELLRNVVAQLGWQASILVAAVLFAAHNLVLICTQSLAKWNRSKHFTEESMYAQYSSHANDTERFCNGPYGSAEHSLRTSRPLVMSGCASGEGGFDEIYPSTRMRRTIFFIEPMKMKHASA